MKFKIQFIFYMNYSLSFKSQLLCQDKKEENMDNTNNK